MAHGVIGFFQIVDIHHKTGAGAFQHGRLSHPVFKGCAALQLRHHIGIGQLLIVLQPGGLDRLPIHIAHSHRQQGSHEQQHTGAEP